jgi:glyceraldehyde 3-phosphate dehydrogenase
MAIKVGINGFGRIGRLVFRDMVARGDQFDILAINDLSDPALLRTLLKYDSVHGQFPGTVESGEDCLVVDGKEVRVLSERSPANLPWKTMGIEMAIESTGVFTRRQTEKGGYADHLKAGARKVIISAPTKDDPDLMVVCGVNDDQLTSNHNCVSNASCTTNCLAPLVKVLHEHFGVVEGLMTTVHAYTNDQHIADQIHKDPRRARAGAINIIPTTTGAARAVGKVLPDLNGKLNGFALRVPVPDGSIVDFVATLKKSATVAAVNGALKAAAEGPMKGILQYCDEPIVSTDVIHNPHSSIVDSLSTMTMPADGGNMVKVIAWYDNEWGYSCRTVDLAAKMAAL